MFTPQTDVQTVVVIVTNDLFKDRAKREIKRRLTVWRQITLDGDALVIGGDFAAFVAYVEELLLGVRIHFQRLSDVFERNSVFSVKLGCCSEDANRKLSPGMWIEFVFG